jgi:hypothetical protein
MTTAVPPPSASCAIQSSSPSIPHSMTAGLCSRMTPRVKRVLGWHNFATTTQRVLGGPKGVCQFENAGAFDSRRGNGPDKFAVRNQAQVHKPQLERFEPKERERFWEQCIEERLIWVAREGFELRKQGLDRAQRLVVAEQVVRLALEGFELARRLVVAEQGLEFA